MGDRYILNLKCAYCNKENDDILYIVEWSDSFKCKHCNKNNLIMQEFTASKEI